MKIRIARKIVKRGRIWLPTYNRALKRLGLYEMHRKMLEAGPVALENGIWIHTSEVTENHEDFLIGLAEGES